MKRIILAGILSALIPISISAQVPDTTGIYGERHDNLKAAVATARQDGSYLSKGKDLRTEVITSAGLCRMACCSLAESFENSASVTVGYSDAITGARQIRLLGQSGIYTQMLDENRPVMRGLSAPWGLTFVPSQWLESIQVAKGVTSVINGVESMTGQINMEHRKPTDERPLYVQASYMSDSKADLNIVSSLQLDELYHWSTAILAHIDGNFKTMDQNGDGFMDDPKQLNLSLSNRWLYFSDDELEIRFGVRAIQDRREGGQMNDNGWRSNILNRSLGGYFKLGKHIDEEETRSIALITDYTFQNLGSSFALRSYNAGQHSAFANFIFQDHSNDQHHLTLGLSDMLDVYSEEFLGAKSSRSVLNDFGAYGEYTFHSADETTFSAIVGLRADWYNGVGVRVSPRLTLKWAPSEQIVFRANGGRGIRFSTPLIDNIGVLSTGKTISGDYLSHPIENSWTFGGNATWYLPFDESGKTYLSLDYFHTEFTEQMLVDYIGNESISFHTLDRSKGEISRTDNFQVDFSSELLTGFTATVTARFTKAGQTLQGCADGEKPMTSRFKGVLNLQYTTPSNGWIFDFTASLNGKCRVWDFMKSMDQYKSGYTPTYPLLFAQVTKRFKTVDIYVGGENLTGFTQKDPIISAANPSAKNFDASCIWGPLKGAAFYAGIRLSLSKP